MSSPELYIGIDAGTTSVKAVLVRGDGLPIRQEFTEYETLSPSPLYREQRPGDWWHATITTLKNLIGASGYTGADIRAIAISSQAPTLLGIDNKGDPVGNGIIWMDRRASRMCETTLMPHENLIIEHTGNRVDPYFLLPKLLHQRVHSPEEFSRVKTLVQVNGWIAYKLTGELSMDKTHAALSQMYDINASRWSSAILDKFDIDSTLLPTVFQPDSIIGRLSKKAAEETGLSPGISVLAGCIDGASAPYGLGMLEEGSVFEMSGQSSGIGLILHKPVTELSLCLLSHAVLDKWILKGSMSSSGGSLRWFRDVLDEKPGKTSAYEHYDMLASQSVPGARGVVFLPYLTGERAPLWDSYARGMFFGISASTTKADMIRAVMEGTAYGLLSIMDEFPKDKIGTFNICGTGGGYKSSIWSQIKADVLQRPIQVGNSAFDSAALGAGYLAIRAFNNKFDPQKPECITVYTPDESKKDGYMNNYMIYKELYRLNKELFKLNSKNQEII